MYMQMYNYGKAGRMADLQKKLKGEEYDSTGIKGTAFGRERIRIC
jgi:hypothetical protein